MAKRKVKRLNGLFCISVIILLLIFACAMYVRAEELMATKAQLEQSYKEQKKAVSKNIELVNKIAYHDSDEYIEKLAREQLGLVKPNEIVFIDENK